MNRLNVTQQKLKILDTLAHVPKPIRMKAAKEFFLCSDVAGAPTVTTGLSQLL